MTTYAILNGVHVYASLINPKEHLFLGMYRPAANPLTDVSCDVLCRCGEMLRYRGQEREHYLKGCYDLPQYATIPKQASCSQYAGYCLICHAILKFDDLPFECSRSPCGMPGYFAASKPYDLLKKGTPSAHDDGTVKKEK